jgi:hypothetical protein
LARETVEDSAAATFHGQRVDDNCRVHLRLLARRNSSLDDFSMATVR